MSASLLLQLEIWGVVLVAVFLIGFLPPYLRANRLESELQAAVARINGLELRDGIANVYFEATRKNFGLAGTEATEFFNDARQATLSSNDPGLKSVLEEILQSRDTITAGLAQADPQVIQTLQNVYVKTRNATER